MATKTKANQKYKMLSGEIVPSVTTVLGILAKPALIHWAWDCGMKGEDYRKVRDTAADIGTLAQFLILCHLKGEKPDLSEYSPADVDKAETCLIKYWDWEKANPFTPVLVKKGERKNENLRLQSWTNPKAQRGCQSGNLPDKASGRLPSP